MRLSLIYALLDRSPVIKVEHLLAANAVWQYNERSVKYIFGDTLGQPEADAILDALKEAPEGLTQAEIYRDVFNNHTKSKEIAAVLSELMAAELVKREEIPTKGRPQIRYLISNKT